MFKRTVVILLLITLVGSNLSAYFIYAGFEVNQKELAEKFCENKSRPWMHCNGKCYLMKKLKAAEEKEKKQERDSQRTANPLFLPTQPALFCFAIPAQKTDYFPVKIEQPVSCTLSIFQPPRQTV